MKITLINSAPAIISDSGDLLMKNITCGIRYRKNETDLCESLEQSEWTLTENDGVTTASTDNAKLTFRAEGRGITVSCEYTYRGEHIKRTDDFIMLKGELAEHVHTLLAPRTRESNGIKTNEMLTSIDTFHLPCKDFPDGRLCECGDFAAFITVSEKEYLAGYLTYNEFFGGVHVGEYGGFEAVGYTEQFPASDGTVFESDVLFFTPCDDIVTALPEYCDLSVKYSVGEPRRKFDVPSGYCTWYYYLGDISQDIVGRAVEDMSAHRGKLPVKYIQIDDGWQVWYGQWETNDNFTDGMKACADKIKAAGFTPGLWFAPLWANKARVRQEHPEYFAVRRDNGERSICFDFSVPEACDFISDVFRRATYEWGYKYLKLDLITTTLGAYEYSDPNFNSLKNYKKCLEIINAAVPDDTFLLGCTAPFGPSIGLVDGLRVSCDISEDWNSIKEVFNRVLKRYYYHKRFFINDADCLIIRKAENEDEECRRNCIRNDDEIKTYVSMTAASGGVLMFSDKLRLMHDEQIDIMSYLFPQNTEAALPLDLMGDMNPGVLDNGLRGKIRTVMLINWDDKPKKMTIDADGKHVFEFWLREYKGTFCGNYETVIPPHCCEVLFLTEAGEPAVIGADSELIPVIKQNFDGSVLRVEFNKKGESFYIAADELAGDNCDITKLSDGLYQLRQIGDNMNVELNVR